MTIIQRCGAAAFMLQYLFGLKFVYKIYTHVYQSSKVKGFHKTVLSWMSN